VAVGRGARDHVGAERPTRTAAIFDDRLLAAPDFRELRRHDSRDDVGAAAGRERDDDPDGLGGKGMRHSRRQGEEQRDDALLERIQNAPPVRTNFCTRRPKPISAV